MDDFDWYRLFKTLHVLGVILLGSGAVFEAVLGPMMPRAANVQELRVYTRILNLVERVIFPVAALLVAGFGYATASRLHIDLTTTWLLLGQILFFVAVGLGFGYLSRASRRLHEAVLATPDGPLTDDLKAQLANPLPAILGGLSTLLFIVIVFLMVDKPNW